MILKFDQPTRQSKAAIVLIIIKTYRLIIGQIWPLLVLALVGGNRKSYTIYLALFVGIFATVGMLFSIINYFKFRFWISQGEFIVQSGVLSSKRLAIPLHRIQSINIEETIVHRLLGVVGVEVDTAGSGKNELKLQALRRHEAEALRNALMEHQPSRYAVSDSQGNGVPVFNEVQHQITRLDIDDLIKIGLTQNHLRSGLLILGFFIWAITNLQEVGVDLYDYTEDIESGVTTGLAYAVQIFLFLCLVTIGISMVRAFVKYYDLRFTRIKDGFTVQSGLLTRKSINAKDHKIQILSWSDNLLRKLIKVYELEIKQAVSGDSDVRPSIKVPGMPINKIEQVVQHAFGDLDWKDLPKRSVDFAYFWRPALFISPLMVAVGVIGALISKPWIIMVALITWSILILGQYLKYKKTLWGYDEFIMVLHGGSWGDKVSLIQTHKIQACRIKQSPWQRRKQLADIEIETAARKLKIPYLEEDVAFRVLNECVYLIEREDKSWI